MVHLDISSTNELNTVIINYTDPFASYNVTVNYFMTQEEMFLLADSHIGQRTKILSIIPEKSAYSPQIDYSSVIFPQLLTLEIHYQQIKAIHFTKDNMPRLKHLSIKKVIDCIGYCTMSLPDLETLDFEFITFTDSLGFGKSLSKSPKLKYVSCYNCMGLRDIKRHVHVLVLPNCENLDIYRSEDLCYMNIWAPKLMYLNLQACNSIKEVNILDRIPQGYKRQSKTQKIKLFFGGRNTL